jgi:hypothetical protein
MTFSNPIVGGTTLIRPAIHSPDYVAGTTGWTINKDGTAEFNDVVFRGSAESANYVAGVSGWKLDQDGDAEFNSIQIRSSGTAIPITVGADTGPQVKIATSANLGVISFPTNRPGENLIAGILSRIFNSGAANERLALQLLSPTVDPSAGRAIISLNSDALDGTNPASADITGNLLVTGNTTIVGSLTQTTGVVQLANRITGTASITPSAANTPTSLVVTFPRTLTGSTFTCQVTPGTSVPGTTVTGVGYTALSATGVTLWLTRTNTTATTVSYTVEGF